MNITSDIIDLGDISFEVTRKNIKNVHLSVHPPIGRVTIAAPYKMDLDTLRLFSISKLNWIRKQQLKLRNQKREAVREYINRESHYYLGQRYLLKVIEEDKIPKVVLSYSNIELHLRPGSTVKQKEKLLHLWYRRQLQELISQLIPKLEKKMGVKAEKIRVRAMRTKWGTCKKEKKKIWLNTELAKKPIEEIEYVLVHEMVHLIERNHNDKFIKNMDKFLPKWKQLREELNRSTLGHIEWSY